MNDKVELFIAVDVSAKVINFLLITTAAPYKRQFCAVDVSAKVINFLLITTINDRKNDIQSC